MENDVEGLDMNRLFRLDGRVAWVMGALVGSAEQSPKDSDMPGLVLLSRTEADAVHTEAALRSMGIDATGIACHMGSMGDSAGPRHRHRGTFRGHRRRGQQRCERGG